MHTAPLGECVSEVAVRAGDPVLRQVLLQPGRLGVRVILLLPASKILTGNPFVLGLPGNQALGTGHSSAVGTHQLLVLRVSQEPKWTLGDKI